VPPGCDAKKARDRVTVWYATREDVKSALDTAETARNNATVDRAIEAASRAIDGMMHRRFYPEIATRYFPWPNWQYAQVWRLWLERDELISVTSLVSGGTTIPAADYFLEPVNLGPPYTSVEIDLSSTSGFSAGSTHQRAIAITGTFGYSADSEDVGTLAAAVSSSSVTTIDVSDSSAIGVGHLIKVDSERMTVTGKTMLTTSQTLQTPVSALASDVTIAVTTGTSYAVGETLLLDSERMLIVDIAGNNLTVKRAWDGTVLAAHTGSTIYAPRRLTVTRGAVGTTAATHSNGAAITRHVVPGLIKELCIAEALNTLLQEGGGYSRVVGAGSVQTTRQSGANARLASGAGLDDIRDAAYTTYGRKARIRAI
jgi:hypothetical protein